MTTGMLLQQDTIQTLPSASGPRFRPYACPNHHVTKGRYITSNDSRGYIPVYEYPLNGQWIMMDIDDGYILWTGIWKALGNSKADIVKMIDSQPDLAPLIRRVRGGYLKIQGTWMPYEVALKLSRRVAWTIRDDLIPLFGPTFPSTCLSPDQPGYGQVVPTGHNKRRPRRPTQNSIMEMPQRAPGWTVVTPNVNMALAPSIATPFHAGPAAATTKVRSPSDYHMSSSPYSVYTQTIPANNNIPAAAPSDIRLSPIPNSVSTIKSGSTTTNLDSHRYGGYLSVYRNPASPSSKTSLSVDIGLRSDGGGSSSDSRLKETKEFSLPPIHSPHSNRSSPSPYSLPPISSIEEIGGTAPQDSAAVLRRLRMDDDSYNKSDHLTTTEERTTWGRRHSLSIHSSSPRSIEASSSSSRFQPYNNSSRSYQDRSFNMGHSPGSTHSYHHHHQQRTQKNDSGNATTTTTIRSDATSSSQYSHECDSTSNTSPTSPTTPNSALSTSSEYGHLYMPKGTTTVNAGKVFPPEYPDRIAAHHHHRHHHQWSTTTTRHGRIIQSPEIISVRRNSFSDGESIQPYRPW